MPHRRAAARGSLTLAVAPFVDQRAFDRRLWSCDLNIVRGEDSFVRAQWAARPFVWHVYPQADDAHFVKLAAFLDRYTEGLDAATRRDAAARILERFNGGDGAGDCGRVARVRAALPRAARARAALGRRARARSRTLPRNLLISPTKAIIAGFPHRSRRRQPRNRRPQESP